MLLAISLSDGFSFLKHLAKHKTTPTPAHCVHAGQPLTVGRY